MLSVWEERKVRLYGEHANIHQSHSQNDSGDLRGVAGGNGELGYLCGKAGTSHLCDGSTHSSGCVVNGSNAREETVSFTEVFYERTNQRAYKASIYIRRHPEQCVRYDSITALTHTHTHTHTHTRILAILSVRRYVRMCTSH